MFQMKLLLVGIDIQRAALEQVDYEITIRVHVDGILNIHWILVDMFQGFQNSLHQ